MCTCDGVFSEDIHPLAAENRVMIGCGQRVGEILLEALPIAAVLRLTAYHISYDTIDFTARYERNIIAACSISGGHRWHDIMRTGIPAINAVIFVNNRRMAGLREQSSGLASETVNPFPALIVQAKHFACPPNTVCRDNPALNFECQFKLFRQRSAAFMRPFENPLAVVFA